MKLSLFRKNQEAHLLKICEERLKMIQDLEALAEARLAEILTLKARLEDFDAARVNALDRLARTRSQSLEFVTNPVPVMLGFDIEPDRRVVDLQNPSWKGAENLFGRFETLRRQVQAAGIDMRVTWFARADPQIKKANGESEWALRRFQGQLRSAEQAGDEIALHMHPWRWAGSDEGWVQDFSDDSWILECLDISMRSFSRVFGRFPCAYRGGDRYMSNSIVRALEKRGVQVDFTLERVNGVERLVDNENSTGQIPDCSSVPAKAFRASRSDFRIPSTDDCRALAMCPLTAAGEATLVPWTDRLVFEEQLETLMNEKEALTHLAFVARSDLALLPEWEEFEANVHALARYARQGQLIFATATDTGRQAGLPS